MERKSLILEIVLAPVRFFDAILDRALSLAGAFVLCQYPQFKMLYMQRLGGHVDELSRIVKAYTAAAKSVGLSLDGFVVKHLSSNAQEFRESGRIMNENVHRFNDLSAALKAVTETDPRLSIIPFLRHLDLDIARKTLKTFTPGIPFSTEGLAYALLGMVLAMLVYWTLKKALQGLVYGIFVKKKKSAIRRV